MGHIIDQIPLWWILPLVLGGGGAAALVLIPGALAFALGIWNALPSWLRLTIIGIGTVGLAILYGRNKGARDAREAQARRDAAAVRNREVIHRDIEKLDRAGTDKRLDRWMRD